MLMQTEQHWRRLQFFFFFLEQIIVNELLVLLLIEILVCNDKISVVPS